MPYQKFLLCAGLKLIKKTPAILSLFNQHHLICLKTKNSKALSQPVIIMLNETVWIHDLTSLIMTEVYKITKNDEGTKWPIMQITLIKLAKTWSNSFYRENQGSTVRSSQDFWAMCSNLFEGGKSQIMHTWTL